MGKKAFINDRGHTLAELIATVAVVAVLSSIAIPSYDRYMKAAKEKVCMLNRKTVLYEYYLYTIDEPETGLSEYIHTHYPEGINCLCPGEGTLTADGSGETATLSCSVHTDEIVRLIPDMP